MNATQVKSLISKNKVGRHSAGNGLYLRIANKGSVYWVVRYSMFGKRREISIGKYPEVSLVDANAEAAQIKVDVKNKRDPIAERAREDNTTINIVDELAADWLVECDKRLKHPKIPRQVYRDYISPGIGQIPLEQISPRDIRAIINKVVKSGFPARANDVLMYCKQLFRHGVKLDLISVNPAQAFTVDDAGGVEKSRDRALSFEELEKVFACFCENADQFTRENYLAFALLLVLGVRKGELITAEWSEINSKKQLWLLPETKSKTGTPIVIPLPPPTLGWFKELHIRANGSPFVFPNRRSSKRGHISHDTLNAALNKLFDQDKMPVTHFTVHDLRRTCRSLLARLGVPGYVAERCLNHKLKGVEGIYDRYDYLDERREALEQLALQIEPLIDADTTSNF